MKSVVRLGSGSGFWGDALDPAVELVERAELDYLSLDYLAELTMAVLQRQRLKNSQEGLHPRHRAAYDRADAAGARQGHADRLQRRRRQSSRRGRANACTCA